MAGAEFIADCLKYNTTLSTLDLRANGLGDDVCIIVGTCSLNLHVLYDPSFLTLFLFLKGAICLARSLKIINESLKSLDLGFNEIRVRTTVFRVSAIGISPLCSTSFIRVTG